MEFLRATLDRAEKQRQDEARVLREQMGRLREAVADCVAPVLEDVVARNARRSRQQQQRALRRFKVQARSM